MEVHKPLRAGVEVLEVVAVDMMGELVVLEHLDKDSLVVQVG
jgi:hypothetical protein